jgi:hypothetical protein
MMLAALGNLLVFTQRHHLAKAESEASLELSKIDK